MARAYCERCKVITRWKARRGARIKDVRCRICGGPVRAHRHEDPLADNRYYVVKAAERR